MAAQGCKRSGHKTSSISAVKTFEIIGASDYQYRVKEAMSYADQLRFVGSGSQFRESRKPIVNEGLHSGNSAVYGLAFCLEMSSSDNQVRSESDEELPHKIHLLQIAKPLQSFSSGCKR